MRTERPICLVIFALVGGGAERVMTRMANYWAEKGIPCRLITLAPLGRTPAYPLHPRVHLIGASVFNPEGSATHPLIEIIRPSNAARFVRLRRILRESRPRVIISFQDRCNVTVLIAAAGLGVPVIVSERVHTTSLGFVWDNLRRLTYPRAAAVVAQTQLNAAQLRSRGFDNVIVLPNPVIAPPAEGSRKSSQLGPFVLAVGRLEPQKDYPTLLRAWSQIAEDATGWTLVILGQGTQRIALEELADELGVKDSVRFLGWQPDVGSFLQKASIFVMTSRKEGFPNALCEALASGLACVYTDCPSGPSEIIAHEQNGLLVPIEDAQATAEALLRLINDSSLRERLGQAGVQSMRRWALPSVMAKWEELIDSIAKK